MYVIAMVRKGAQEQNVSSCISIAIRLTVQSVLTFTGLFGVDIKRSKMQAAGFVLSLRDQAYTVYANIEQNLDSILYLVLASSNLHCLLRQTLFIHNGASC